MEEWSGVEGEERRGEEMIASVKAGFSFLLCDQSKFRMAMEKNQVDGPTVRSFHPLIPFLSFQHGEVTALRYGVHLSWVTLGSSLPRSLCLLLPSNKEFTGREGRQMLCPHIIWELSIVLKYRDHGGLAFIQTSM
ncbi:hypothetical protein E2320_006517, partial [Naja naja]